VAVDDAASRALLGLVGIAGVNSHTFFEEPKVEVAGLAAPTPREGRRAFAMAHVPHPYAEEGEVRCPIDRCGYHAPDHATAWRERAELIARLKAC